jgi:hypothetical protein
MNVRNGGGPVHHLVDTTRRLLCGHSEPFDWAGGATAAVVSCSACARMLRDDVRRDAQTEFDSED